MKNDWEIEVPYVMGLIGTRSISKQIPGIIEIKEKNRERIVRGIEAVNALEALRKPVATTSRPRERFEAQGTTSASACCSKSTPRTSRQATPEMIQRRSTIPCRASPLFWSFRVMVGLGFRDAALFALRFLEHSAAGLHAEHAAGCCAGPCGHAADAPWLACELGWFVAEYGRQPWTIYGVLPTHLSVSSLSVEIALWLARGLRRLLHRAAGRRDVPDGQVRPQGPGSLGTGRYERMPGHDAPDMHKESTMFDYVTLKLIWWLLVGVLLVGFAIMDGPRHGRRHLLPFVGRSDTERRVIINTVGPHWDGNQVWFITGGGAIFAAWPLVYATAFSGLLLGDAAVLWALFFRPVGL
jgi:hypothetical protein